MKKTYHFISGLPRSGSTLLSSILKQNPRFTAGITDPLLMYASSIINDTNVGAGLNTTVSVDKRKEIIRSVFDTFYAESPEVCFNTNRGWAGSTALLSKLYPGFKMIICVRDIPWILDSFEQLNSKNQFSVKPLYHHQQLNSVYERTHMLMGNYQNFAGYVSGPLDSVKQAMYCNETSQLCFIEYDTLVKFPEYSMKQIYAFLGEEWFEHDFNDVENSYDEFDEGAKIQGLHTTRKKVEFIERTPVLPSDLWQTYIPSTFWKQFPEVKKQLNWINEPKNINNNIYKQLNKQL